MLFSGLSCRWATALVAAAVLLSACAPSLFAQPVAPGDTWTRLGLAVGAAGTDRDPAGVVVVEVLSRGAAASVGVRRGDILTHVNGLRVRSTEHALRTIEAASAAQATVLTLRRDGRDVRIVVPPAQHGDIAPPPPWGTAVPGQEIYPFVRAVGIAGPASSEPPAAAPEPVTRPHVPVALLIRFVEGDPSLPIAAAVALVDGDVTIRETRPVVDGQTARASFAGADEVPTGRAYLVELATVLGRRAIGTLDLREATGPVATTLDAMVPR